MNCLCRSLDLDPKIVCQLLSGSQHSKLRIASIAGEKADFLPWFPSPVMEINANISQCGDPRSPRSGVKMSKIHAFVDRVDVEIVIVFELSNTARIVDKLVLRHMFRVRERFCMAIVMPIR